MNDTTERVHRDDDQSDVDLLTIGLRADRAATIGARLSADFSQLCRGVEIAAGMAEDFEGAADEAYGGRVFLHHCCVHLAGPDLDRATSAFSGDQRAARGLNGDIAQHVARWQRDFESTDARQLGRTVARKSLLAVAGLVSVHDETWTTDREEASRRWGQTCRERVGDVHALSFGCLAQRSVGAREHRCAHEESG